MAPGRVIAWRVLSSFPQEDLADAYKWSFRFFRALHGTSHTVLLSWPTKEMGDSEPRVVHLPKGLHTFQQNSWQGAIVCCGDEASHVWGKLKEDASVYVVEELDKNVFHIAHDPDAVLPSTLQHLDRENTYPLTGKSAKDFIENAVEGIICRDKNGFGLGRYFQGSYWVNTPAIDLATLYAELSVKRTLI